MADNPLNAPDVPMWKPSTWQPGMPGTPSTDDFSNLPRPTGEQIEQQRQLISQRLRQYGYAPRQLSDQEVLSTMAPLPQAAMQWPDWVLDYFRRNPPSGRGARAGIDVPYNSTYEEWNLRRPALNRAVPTSIGVGAYEPPLGALRERYGDNALQAARQADPFWGFNVRDTPMLAGIRTGDASPDAVRAANLRAADWQELFNEKARRFWAQQP